MTYQDHIARDPKICAGQPVIRGTRVPVRVILAHLAHGETAEAIVKRVPDSERGRRPRCHRLRSGLRGRGPSCSKPGSARREGRVRIKLDENIPASSALRLSALGFDVDTVLGEGRFLVTQDLGLDSAVS